MGERERELKVVALVHEENGVFGVSFPDFPGCVTGADTLEEAIRKANEALTFHVAGMLEDGETLPIISDISKINQSHDFEKGARILVVEIRQPRLAQWR